MIVRWIWPKNLYFLLSNYLVLLDWLQLVLKLSVVKTPGGTARAVSLLSSPPLLAKISTSVLSSTSPPRPAHSQLVPRADGDSQEPADRILYSPVLSDLEGI